jgi:hypothetical protein
LSPAANRANDGARSGIDLVMGFLRPSVTRR